jgi:predicted translin family RNA/ssDNA-binding protein
MYSYGLLEPGCYYLVQEEFDSIIELVKVTVETDHCLYVFKYQDELVTEWRRKTDPIYDIIECLDDKKVEAWEKQYNSNNEESYYEEDEE